MKISKSKIYNLLRKKITFGSLLKLAYLVIALFIMYSLYRKGVVAPLFVNGEPVTFAEIATVLNEEGGTSNFLDKVIAEKIIEIEARRRNIVVKKEEIDAEVLRIEKEAVANGRTLSQLLRERDQTLEELQKNIKVRITIYKLISKDIEVSEKEIDDFINQNRDFYKDKEVEQVRKDVKELLLWRKVDNEYQTWIREAEASTRIDYIIRFK